MLSPLITQPSQQSWSQAHQNNYIYSWFLPLSGTTIILKCIDHAFIRFFLILPVALHISHLAGVCHYHNVRILGLTSFAELLSMTIHSFIDWNKTAFPLIFSSGAYVASGKRVEISKIFVNKMMYSLFRSSMFSVVSSWAFISCVPCQSYGLPVGESTGGSGQIRTLLWRWAPDCEC